MGLGGLRTLQFAVYCLARYVKRELELLILKSGSRAWSEYFEYLSHLDLLNFVS